MEKTVLLGIDGATPELMEKWMDQGKLPNFQKIKNYIVRLAIKNSI